MSLSFLRRGSLPATEKMWVEPSSIWIRASSACWKSRKHKRKELSTLRVSLTSKSTFWRLCLLRDGWDVKIFYNILRWVFYLTKPLLMLSCIEHFILSQEGGKYFAWRNLPLYLPILPPSPFHPTPTPPTLLLQLHSHYLCPLFYNQNFLHKGNVFSSLHNWNLWLFWGGKMNLDQTWRYLPGVLCSQMMSLPLWYLLYHAVRKIHKNHGRIKITYNAVLNIKTNHGQIKITCNAVMKIQKTMVKL